MISEGIIGENKCPGCQESNVSLRIKGVEISPHQGFNGLIGEVDEGKNSVIFGTPLGQVFYERLSNTIHVGDINKLKDLRRKVESVSYTPQFESSSLRNLKGRNLEALILNVTEGCNLACSYCIYSGNYENERTETDSRMEFETTKKSINFFMPLTNQDTAISFYGGEPLVNFQLIREVVDYVGKEHSEKRVVFSMTSNFCSADRHAEFLISNGFYINISLDGPQSVHDKNRKFKDGRPTYEKILRNLTEFERISPEYVKTHIGISATCRESSDLPKVVEFFQQNTYFNVTRINGVEQKGLSEPKERKMSGEEFLNFTRDYLFSITSEEDPGVLRNFFDQGLIKVALRSKEIMPEKLMLQGCCYPGNRKLFVDTNGDFYMCEKFGRRVSIGNVNEGINEQSIDKVIGEFLEIRNRLCNGCWAQRLCSPCILSSKDSEGEISIDGLSQICNTNKSQILTGIVNLAYLTQEDNQLVEEYIKSIKFK